MIADGNLNLHKEKQEDRISGVGSDSGRLVGPLTSSWNVASFSWKTEGINKL